MSSTIFLFLVGAVIFCPRNPNHGKNEMDKLRWGHKKRIFACCVLIVSGPFWGGLIGICGGLLNTHNRTEDRVGFGLTDGVTVGAVGGSVFLSLLGGSVLGWTVWQMQKANKKQSNQGPVEDVDLKTVPKKVEEV